MQLWSVKLKNKAVFFSKKCCGKVMMRGQEMTNMNNMKKEGCKALLVYYSKTGFTQKYAEWIKEALPQDISCDLVPYKERGKLKWEQYDLILFGGGFHAGMINGLKWFKAQAGRLPEQIRQGGRTAVFATGAMPVDAPDVEKAMRQNFTEQEWAQMKTFYLPGGLCYERMGIGDKLMMSVFKAMLKESKVDSRIQQIVASSHDITSKEAIIPIVEWCSAVSRSM